MKKLISFMGLILFGFSFGQQTWSLKKCVDYAVEHNLTVVQNKIQEGLADNNFELKSNQWLPTVFGNFDNSLILGTNHPMIDKGYQQYTNSLGVNSNIIIYNGGLIGLEKERANLNTESYRYQTNITEVNISLQVVNYYLTVMLNRELLRIAEGNLDVNLQQLERSQILYNNGRIARSELVQAEAAVAIEKKNVANAKIEVDRALFNMAVLLQLPDFRGFDVENISLPDDLTFHLYNMDQVVQNAIETMPEVKKSLVDLEMAEKDIEIARTALRPIINGTYNLGTSYSDYFNKSLNTDAWMNQWHDNLTNVFGVSMSIPIFERFANKLNIQKMQINQSVMQNQLDQQKQIILENVQEAYFQASVTFEAYEAAKESVRSNEISADYAEKSFEAGAINLFDVNIARNDLVSAQSQLAQAKYNFVFRLKVLDFYAGIPLTEGLE